MRINPYRPLRFYARTAIIFMLLPFSAVLAQPRDSAIFKDDFDRIFLGNFWDAHTSWSILNGSAFNFIDGTGGSLRTSEAYAQTSYLIETSVRGFTSNYYREFRLTFGQADLSSQQLYQVRYTAYGGGRLTLSKSTDNIYFPQVLDEAAIFPNLNTFQWYTLKIAKYNSGLIQVFMDQGSGYSDVPILEAIDSSYPELGHTGWQVDTQSFAETFYVDWFAASKPGQEKPAVREKPEQDSLITQVSAESGRAYSVAKLKAGVKQHSDRNQVITSLPAYLNGASFIQTANDDKANTSESFLTFFVKAPSVVYIGYDPRNQKIPDWLTEWTKTPDRIMTSDEKLGHLDVYSKSVEYGEIYPYPLILGGNLAGQAVGSKNNYIVAAVKRPLTQSLQAEDAVLSGAAVSTEHQNFLGTGYADFRHNSGDYIEWTVQINVPGTYNLGFRFANGGFEERSLKLSDNRSGEGKVVFSPTFAWDSWAFLSGPNLFLSAGTHKIRLTATGDSGPNIDELSLFFLSATSTSALSSNAAPDKNISGQKSSVYYKAYPNPFLQGTKIYYGLKEKARVNLSVYNMQGQQVQLLDNTVREAGNYQATFDAGNVAKGIYIIKLQVGNEIKTGKLVKE